MCAQAVSFPLLAFQCIRLDKGFVNPVHVGKRYFHTQNSYSQHPPTSHTLISPIIQGREPIALPFSKTEINEWSGICRYLINVRVFQVRPQGDGRGTIDTYSYHANS